AVTEASALQLAEDCHRSVAVDSSRSEFSQVTAHPDGRLTFESTVVPERARRGSGWADIDLRLRPGADGLLRPAVSAADVAFSPGGDTPLVTLTRGGRTMTMTWPGTLPPPSISENAATYREVFPDVDLEVRATETGFAHTLVVKTAEAAELSGVREITLGLGGDADVVARGRELVATAGDTVLASTEPAFAWDSTTSAASLRGVTGPGADGSTTVSAGQGANTGPVAVAVSGSELVLRPDEKLLDPGHVTFPVYIDPAWSVYKNKWAYATNNNSNNTDTSVARVGHNPDTGALYRSFFQFPTTANGVSLKAKHIESARFEMTLDHSWSCEKTVSSMYWSDAIASTMRSNWSKMGLLQYVASTTGRANEAGGCGNIQADMIMNFQGSAVTSFMQKAANGGWSALTVGFTARDSGGDGESTQNRWKRFLPAKAKLFVDYDSRPGTPTSPKVSGVACGSGVVPIGTVTPAFSAYFPDADKSDSLTGTFEWIEVPAAGMGSVTDTSPARRPPPAKKTNITPGAQAVSAAVTAVNNKTFAFRARGTDKAPYSLISAWSAWCQFRVDTTVPVVTATVLTAPDGPGRKGRVRIQSTSTDVTRFQYGWDAATKVVTPTGTNPKIADVDITVPRFGTNVLLLKAVDATLNEGHGSVDFEVSRPSSPVARWVLETYPGMTTPAAALADQAAAPVDSPLTATTVTWAGDVRARGVQTATFNGTTSGAATTAPVINTADSFSVAGWVRPAALPTTDAKFAVQEGTDASAFEIGVRRLGTPLVPYWSFLMKDTAAQSSPTVAAVAPAPILAGEYGRWVHVAGTFDAAEKKLKLYLNGKLVAQADRTATPWAANGRFAVGRGFAGGSAVNFFNGAVADVQVFDRVLVPQDFTGQLASDPQSSGFDEPGILTPTQVGGWNFEAATPCYVADLRDTCEAPDTTTAFGRHLALTRGSEVGAGHTASGQGLWLDSKYLPDADGNSTETTSEYGRSATKTGVTAPDAGGNQFSIWQDQPVLRTDQSLTVSAWAKLNADEMTRNQSVVAQYGAHESGTLLRYRGSTRQWEFMVFAADDAATGTGVYVPATEVAEPGVWTHLSGVYDATRSEVRIYVNGTLAGTKAVTFTPMVSNGPLVVGQSRYHDRVGDQFAGGIDEVVVHQGALTAAAVSALFDAQAANDSGSNTLSAGQAMYAGDGLRSNGGEFELLMQEDGNFVLYQKGRAVWSTGTYPQPGAWLTLQADGNLVVFSSTGTVLWSSNTAGTGAERLFLYDDGDLVLLDSTGRVVWRR
ncbi:MAG TPA: LamG-like jellyroll fold domain-containing protein, partial [Actinoplanes sp.]|nr:LamG-like jellyroll fold domain-containing protein [Actinoplanes sp.]